MDSVPPAIFASREIRDAVGENFLVFYDSGIKSGEDVVKAYAMGADFVFLGRALLFALAAGREAGLLQLWDVLSIETSLTLAQMGKTTMRSLKDVVAQIGTL